jgi:hypothetical protein
MVHKASAWVQEAADTCNKVRSAELRGTAGHYKKVNLIIMKKTHTFSFVVAIPVPAYETSFGLSSALRST